MAAVHVPVLGGWVMEPGSAAVAASFSRQSKGRVQTPVPERGDDDIPSQVENDIEFPAELGP